MGSDNTSGWTRLGWVLIPLVCLALFSISGTAYVRADSADDAACQNKIDIKENSVKAEKQAMILRERDLQAVKIVGDIKRIEGNMERMAHDVEKNANKLDTVEGLQREVLTTLRQLAVHGSDENGARRIVPPTIH